MIINPRHQPLDSVGIVLVDLKQNDFCPYFFLFIFFLSLTPLFLDSPVYLWQEAVMDSKASSCLFIPVGYLPSLILHVCFVMEYVRPFWFISSILGANSVQEIIGVLQVLAWPCPEFWRRTLCGNCSHITDSPRLRNDSSTRNTLLTHQETQALAWEATGSLRERAWGSPFVESFKDEGKKKLFSSPTKLKRFYPEGCGHQACWLRTGAYRSGKWHQ